MLMAELLSVILVVDPLLKVGTEWRKVAKKLEGEEIFEALDKVDRLEVYQVRIWCRGQANLQGGQRIRFCWLHLQIFNWTDVSF